MSRVERERGAQRLSRLTIIAAAVVWSTGGAAIKLSTLTGAQLAGGRAIFAALALYLLLPKARIRWNKNVLKTAVCYAFTCALFVFANTLTTAGNAIFIQNTAPFWVLLLSPWLLAEYPTIWEKLSVPICITGCALFFLDNLSYGHTAGNLCALGASVSYALLIISYRNVSDEEALAGTVCGNVLIIVAMLPFVFTETTLTAIDVGSVIYLGVIQQAVAAWLFIRGIRGVSALEGSLLIVFEPLLSPVWAFFLIGERLGWLAISGGCLIVSATVIRVWTEQKRR